MKAFDFAKKTVLVTGASAGIGAVFAREVSRLGATVILVARTEKKLEALAAELGKAHVIAADLAAPGAAERLLAAVSERGLEVDVLVNNAGFGIHDRFGDIALEAHQEAIQLNVSVLVELTHLFLPMIERRQGGVIQIASVAAFQPVPFMAVYGATKAFVLSFGEALWAEYRARGVRILTLSPGATETSFFQRSGEGAAAGNKKAPAEDVVRAGITAFLAGRPSVVAGFSNKVMTLVSRFFSRKFTLKVTSKMMQPKAPARFARADALAR